MVKSALRSAGNCILLTGSECAGRMGRYTGAAWPQRAEMARTAGDGVGRPGWLQLSGNGIGRPGSCGNVRTAAEQEV